MDINFVVNGEPFGKQRHRYRLFKGKIFTYIPKENKEYEKKVKESYLKVSKHKFDKDIPLSIYITAYFEAKNKKDFKERPTKKPDGDNIIKIILDALNGAAFHDDAQIVDIGFEKFYSEVPKIKICLTDGNDALNY